MGEYEDVAVLYVSVPSLRQSGKLVDRVSLTKDNGIIEIGVTAPVLTHRSRNAIDRAYKRGARKGIRALRQQWQGHPDIALAQTSLPAGQIARYLYDKYELPYGVIEHFSFWDRIIQNQKEEVISVYSSSSFLGAVSFYLRDVIKKQLPNIKDPEFAPNVLGRAFEHYNVEEKKLVIDDAKPFKWLWIGDDKQEKHPDLLARTLARLPKNRITVTVVGEGRFESLRALQRQGYRIQFYKNVPRSRMPDMMSRHNALISTSFIETFGMAIIEMLSLGRPVAITPSGGPEMFLTPDRGIVAGEHTAIAVAEAMQTLMNTFERFNSEQLRSGIINEYGSQAYHRRLLELINKI